MTRAVPRPLAPFRGVTVDDLRRVVDWLDSDQPADAVIWDHGATARVGDFDVSISPDPPAHLSIGTVVTFQLPHACWERDEQGQLTNGISARHRKTLQNRLARVAPVIGHLDGSDPHSSTCSFHIDREPGEHVRRARARYEPFETAVAFAGIPPAAYLDQAARAPRAQRAINTARTSIQLLSVCACGWNAKDANALSRAARHYDRCGRDVHTTITRVIIFTGRGQDQGRGE